MKFFSLLKWLDGRPLVIEPYRKHIFSQALFSFNANGAPLYNLVLAGRAKKNWKTADLILAALYRLLAWQTGGGNECYILANDLGQAGDDLDLAKKLIRVNPILENTVEVKREVIERKDGQGFLEILPAQDVAGAHGKTYLFCGFDEIHEYRNWDLFEAMQLDPTRLDAMMWITSYASIYHRPGVPLFDLLAGGWNGKDTRMFFSWYASDRTTDPDFENALPEDRANPSRNSWNDPGYLEQQQRRLPAHNPALCGDDYASSLGEFPLHQDPGRLFVIDDEHLNRMFQTQDLSPPTPVATGSRIVTVVPLPSPSLLTSIDPPCCSIIP